MSSNELRRYIVSFRSINTGIDKWTQFDVVTWNGERKAIALAAMAHAGRSPRTGILEVEVEERNVGEIKGSDLVDRMEW